MSLTHLSLALDCEVLEDRNGSLLYDPCPSKKAWLKGRSINACWIDRSFPSGCLKARSVLLIFHSGGQCWLICLGFAQGLLWGSNALQTGASEGWMLLWGNCVSQASAMSWGTARRGAAQTLVLEFKKTDFITMKTPSHGSYRNYILWV